MTDSLKSELQTAAAHYRKGQLDDALTIYEQLIGDYPLDPDVLSNAGLTCNALGHPEKAMNYLEQALHIDPSFESAFYTLIDVALEHTGRAQAAALFRAFEKAIPTSSEKKSYEGKLVPLPVSHTTSKAVASTPASSMRPRIAFICGPDRKFITNIARELGKHHNVRTAYFTNQLDLSKVQAVMDWADVTWFEWCDEILVHASQKLEKTSAVMCRLHRYEAFKNYPQRVNWSFVDTLVPTTHHILDVLKRNVTDIEDRTNVEVISSTVDLARYTFKRRMPGFDLAYIGYLHHRKNPALLLQCMQALIQIDDRYHLHIAGTFQQPVWELYFDHMLRQLDLNDHLTLYGWVDDIASWLDDKHYVVLPTIHEGNPYSVLEGAARGLKPVVHHFPGAEELYPNSWLFNTVEDFVERVREDVYTPQMYRDYVAQRYSLNKTIRQISTHVQYLTSSPPAEKPLPAAKMEQQNRAENQEERDVEMFYNHWTERLINDYARGNPRVIEALRYTIAHLPAGTKNVLDVGCGIGWSSHEIGRHLPEAAVLGVDLSPSLIQIAERLFKDGGRIDFKARDVTKNVLNGDGPFQAAVLLDVYEHIPRDQRLSVIRSLSKALASDSTIILSCPTPRLQRYLKQNDPQKLQPVDEIVTRDDLEEIAHHISGQLVDYRTLSVWLKNDYFHATIQRGTPQLNQIDINLETPAERIYRIQRRMPSSQMANQPA